MKKISAIIISFMICVSAFAQTDGLKGSWTHSAKAMGFTVKQTLTFSEDNAGTVTNVIDMAMNFNFLGYKSTGEIEASYNGTYTCEGDQIIIKWDKDSYQMKEIVPITDNAGSSKVEGKEDSTEDSMKKDLEDIKENETFTNVKVKGDKLSYKMLDDKGKVKTQKFDRVK